MSLNLFIKNAKKIENFTAALSKILLMLKQLLSTFLPTLGINYGI
jgi:hypothetical protein